ncbi:MAG: glycosyltransferase family 4 protein [Pseudomonadota bacterium]
MSQDKPARTVRILHCHSTFSAGGKELRSVELMNAFGSSIEHTIISGEPDQYGAAQHIAKRIKTRYPRNFPALKGAPTPWRLASVAKAIQPFDLVLTYNWGAMDVAMAHTAFSKALKLPPLIHHEDGFNEDEATELKGTRNWYRKIALGRSSGLVVPSRVLETIALEQWEQPRGRVIRIPNGIDTKAFSQRPKPERLRVMKHEGEKWIGTLAGLRPVKQLDHLVRALRELPEEWNLVILGEGPERERILETAVEFDLSHRVHLPGKVNDPASVIGLFDIFALSSQSEQFPLSVVEAMAAGLPVVAPDVGDVRRIVAEPNQPFIAESSAPEALAQKMTELLDTPRSLREVGEANRRKATAQFDRDRMVDRYRELYESALGHQF